MNEPRKKLLSDILSEGERKKLFGNWSQVRPAPDYGPLPAGLYTARLRDGYFETANTGTPCYCLEFEITEGDHSGRRVWHRLWFTERALPGTKRDLLRLGVTDPETQLERALPRWFVCKVRLGIEADNKGEQKNVVRTFEVLRIDPPEVDPFTPKSGVNGQQPDPDQGTPGRQEQGGSKP
jgi:hypothetical protein